MKRCTHCGQVIQSPRARPLANTTYHRGDERADGYRFVAYEKRNGRLREKWLNPASFERQQQKRRAT